MYRVYRYIHDPKNVIHDTYKIDVALLYNKIFINLSHNFLQKIFQIFLKLSLNVFKILLNFLILFKFFQNCQKQICKVAQKFEKFYKFINNF